MLTGCLSRKQVGGNKNVTVSQTESIDKQVQEMIVDTIVEAESNEEDNGVESFVDACLGNPENVNTEKDVAKIMMKSYSSHVDVKIIEKMGTTMKLEIKAPNMVMLLNKAIEELKNADNFSKAMIEEKVKEYIDRNAFEFSIFKVVVEYIEEDGKVIIQENAEYLNAIYGGMLFEAQNRYNEYKESVSKEDMVND